MPFCPKCGFEYRDEITICPDCNETLVASLPEKKEEPDNPYENWVQVARLTSHQYAVMIIEALRNKNIPAILQSGAGYFGQTGQLGISSFQPIGGGYSLLVPEKFVAAANEEAESILGDEWDKARLDKNDR